MTDNQNHVVQPLLTDFYQITMAYAYWKSGKMNDRSVFDLFFRKNPFRGEYTIFAGLEECIKFVKNYKISDTDIEYLRKQFPEYADPEFFEYLKSINPGDVTIYAVDEGTVVFPRIPLLRVEGPLPVVQLLETTLLTLVNYASLVATNAARFRLAAGASARLLEFGLRRAQGPDGGLSASRYCYMGGFDGTSNVLAGKLYGIPVSGTHAHAYVNSYDKLEDLPSKMLLKNDGSEEIDIVELSKKWLRKIAPLIKILPEEAHSGELAAFISYAQSFPQSVLCLIDTYDTIRSGLPNFCAVALALHECGYEAKGVRIDSGDLAYISNTVRQVFRTISKELKLPFFEKFTIVASNDINEDTIHSLHQQGNSIDAFGIGTHLVTCQRQPALGCVFKLVELNGLPKIKLSEDAEKTTMPGRKQAFRLFGKDGDALVDLLQQLSEDPPKPNEKVLCRHPFQNSKRAYVCPAKVEPLHHCYWKNGKICRELPSLAAVRERTLKSLKQVRQDHRRALNPTPYKVSVSPALFTFMHELWLENAPIGELS